MITYETFSTLMQESGVHNQWEYQELYDRRIVPKSVPRDPAREYKRHHPKWRSFNEAKKFVHTLNISDFKEWHKYATSDKKPSDIPYSPDKVYKDKGWIGIRDWLGSGLDMCKYPTYNQLVKIVRKAKIKSHKEYMEWFKKTKATSNGKWIKNGGIPANPDRYYGDRGQWKSWGVFLGTNRVANRLKNDPPLRPASLRRKK